MENLGNEQERALTKIPLNTSTSVLKKYNSPC